MSYLLVVPGHVRPAVPISDVAPDLVRRRRKASADLARLTDSFHLNLTAFGFLAFAVGLFIVHSAIGLAFEQRRSVFRTLRALGAFGAGADRAFAAGAAGSCVDRRGDWCGAWVTWWRQRCCPMWRRRCAGFTGPRCRARLGLRAGLVARGAWHRGAGHRRGGGARPVAGVASAGSGGGTTARMGAGLRCRAATAGMVGGCLADRWPRRS